jgi:GT2 family glycosyltransferase
VTDPVPHPPARPDVDVVVPFAGSDAALQSALARLAGLDLRAGDTLTIADNRPGVPSTVSLPERFVLVDAGARKGSYFARNRGAEAGRNPWIVFLDADTEPPADLLDRFFAEPPAPGTGILGGAVLDEAPADGATATSAVRFAHRFALMSQSRTLARSQFAYVQTANCAVRRDAFAAVGGFEESIRSGGDADICFRVGAAGWALEHRDGAQVVHRSRTTLVALLRQRARVGAGARWLEERYPGFSPRRPLPRALAGNARLAARGLLGALRGGDREDAMVAVLEGLTDAAFQLGWRLPNDMGPARR